MRMAVYMGSIFHRLDVYADGAYIQPENVEKHGSLLIYKPGDYQPEISAENNGANWLDMQTDTIHVIVRGGSVIDIKLQPVIVLGLNVSAVSVDEFFEENLIQNLTKLLGIDAEDIALHQRYEELTYFEVDIGYVVDHSHTSHWEDPDSYNSMGYKLKESIQTGEFHRELGIITEAITIMNPLLQPPNDLYLEMTYQIENNTWTAENIKTVETITMYESPTLQQDGTTFATQPKVLFEDENVSLILIMTMPSISKF